MQAFFGYKDGSGEFFIVIDTDKCTGCGDCVPACPAQILALTENEYDPLAERQIAVVKDAHRKSIKYDCAPCKPTAGVRALPCIDVCRTQAIVHSW